MSNAPRCPGCGQPLPADAPPGVCSDCLSRASREPTSGPMEADQSTAFDVPHGFEPTELGHVLETLVRSIGPITRVMLPDAAPSDGRAPVVKPSSAEMPAASARGERYQLFGEIARGGMGAVLRGRDADLGRDLAIKVLLDEHRDRPELIHRFIEEAQISGQLQHPGIVPVYELGAFADHRPYFSMKLVQGRTLAALLRERAGLPAELPRFLSIFEAVCQTVAYAHARAVIHRDLKPSNVMVGSFGEVQVMDWGLAKVLPRGGAADDERAGKPIPKEAVVATARDGSAHEHSRFGSVLGTPSYMAPEQAAGAVERVDERADVFALGSILCEILTGHPAFTGQSSGEIVRKASRGDTAEALARLDASGADVELVRIARDCLAGERDRRPRHAGIVAERITAYLAGAQERVRKAELASVEERARRKLTMVAATSLLILTTAGGLSTTYYLQQRQARAAAVEEALARASLLRDQARQRADDPARWQAARAAVDQAAGALGGAARERLAALRSEVEAGAWAAETDQKLLERLAEIRGAKADDPDGFATDAGYAEAFRAADLDLKALPPAEAAQRIKSRPPAVAAALVSALDDWANLRRGDREGARRLSQVADEVDPDPWRQGLRAALVQPDRGVRLASLKDLAGRADPEELGPVSLELLGSALFAAGDPAAAETVLRRAQRHHPGDVWLNYQLGLILESVGRTEQAIRYYAAARALRPETAYGLANALVNKGESDEAIEVSRQLCRIRPGNGRHLVYLGRLLRSRGQSDEGNKVLEAGVSALREEARLHPDSVVTHNNLGNALWAQGKLDEAIAEYRAVIRLNPGLADAHTYLGNALRAQGKLDEAVAECRVAVRLNPDFAEGHHQLSVALADQGKHDEAAAASRAAIRLKPDDAVAHIGLARVLAAQGKLDVAAAASRAAIRLKPDFAEAHYSLATTLTAQGKLDEAAAEFSAAIGLRRDYAEAYFRLGSVLADQRKQDEAIAKYRAAIGLKPSLIEAHYKLASALADQDKFDEAAAEFRAVIALKPDDAGAHCNLGLILGRRGDHDAAVSELRLGHELGSRRPDWRYPSAQWLEEEKAAALADRLPGILRGEKRPVDAAEGLAAGKICSERGLHAVAARLWKQALDQDPKLAADRQSQPRYNAARSAALAGSGNSKDDPPPDEAARARLRGQAREWLSAELAEWTKLLESGGSNARPTVAQALRRWKEDVDLAGIRAPDALAKLPTEEQEAWRSLWTEVDGLLKKAGSSGNSNPAPSGVGR